MAVAVAVAVAVAMAVAVAVAVAKAAAAAHPLPAAILQVMAEESREEAAVPHDRNRLLGPC